MVKDFCTQLLIEAVWIFFYSESNVYQLLKLIKILESSDSTTLLRPPSVTSTVFFRPTLMNFETGDAMYRTLIITSM